jgi:hypothetical protein
MRTGWIKKLLCVLCLVLPVVLAGVAMAQSKTPSVLDRVQKVDDPELSELIRVTMESRKDLLQKEKLEVIRKVTLGYVQIKLLDQQIAEVFRKVEAATGPAEIQYELLLAKTELESKLAAELANLRELMGVIPKHAFDEKPLQTLNTWVHLHTLDQGVYVLEALKPFEEFWAAQRFKSSGLLSEREVLDYVRKRLRDPNNLPIRMDIHHTAAMSSPARDLRGKVISLVKETNSQMEAEVHMEPITWVGSGESTFFLRGGTIRTLHAAQVKRPDGAFKPLVTGVVEPNDLEQHILWRLLHPGNVPLKFRIEYDEASAELARQTADKVRAVAKDLGIVEIVDVERALVDSVPETAFLGRWQAITKGEFRTIDIQPTGVCLLGISGGSVSTRAGASIPGKWLLTPKEIVMDIKEKKGNNFYVYRGYLDKDGNLVVDKGMIYPQGSFHLTQPVPMIFKKVY